MNKNIKQFRAFFMAFLLISAIFSGANRVEASTTKKVTTCNSATFNAYVAAIHNDPTTVWFEWGEGRGIEVDDDEYVNTTTSQTLNSNGNVSETVFGLAPETIYYYRAIAENNSGMKIGDRMVFQTAACAPSPAPVQPVAPTQAQPATTTIVSSTTTKTSTVKTSDKKDTIAEKTKSSASDQKDSAAPLSANALSAGAFLPKTLLGWLFLSVLILLIVILGRHHWHFNLKGGHHAEPHH